MKQKKYLTIETFTKSYRTILLVRAHNINEDNINDFKETLSDYLDLCFPENKNDKVKKDTDLLAGWEGLFKKGSFEVQLMDEGKELAQVQEYEKKFKLKNLAKS